MSKFLCLVALNFFFVEADAQPTYIAGYRNLKFTDSSRIYKPGSTATDPLHYRVVDIDYWYPAMKAANNTPLSFRYFLKLFKTRAEFYADADYRGVDTSFAVFLSKMIGAKDSLKLFKTTLNSYRNAIAARSDFPLIIYYCSYGTMSFENISFFEKLAANGFSVAAITSLGRFPGEMTMHQEDLLQHVMDGQFALKQLKRRYSFQHKNIGVMGYSWGGPAAIITAHREKAVSCVLSWDGSERHYYGSDKEGDSLWNVIRHHKEVRLTELKIPYLYISSDRSSASPDSIWAAGNTNPWYQFATVDSSTHGDFTNFAAYLLPESPNHLLYTSIEEMSLGFFIEQLYRRKGYLRSVMLNKIGVQK